MSAERPRAGRRGDHETFDQLAVGWALHALEPEDEAAFARHLPDCARCEHTVTETTEIMAALAADLPRAEPSEGLRERLHAAVEETEQVPPPAAAPDLEVDVEPPAAPVARRQATGFPFYNSPSRVADERPRWRRGVPAGLVAAALAAILGLGAWNVFLAASRDEMQATANEQAAILQEVLKPGQAAIAPVTDDGGHSLATVVARDGQVQVITHGLTVNDPRSTTYVVWGMGDDAPVPLGTFDVVHARMDLRTVGSDQTGLADYAGYAISLEPGRQAPSTPTDVVAKGQVTR